MSLPHQNTCRHMFHTIIFNKLHIIGYEMLKGRIICSSMWEWRKTIGKEFFFITLCEKLLELKWWNLLNKFLIKSKMCIFSLSLSLPEQHFILRFFFRIRVHFPFLWFFFLLKNNDNWQKSISVWFSWVYGAITHNWKSSMCIKWVEWKEREKGKVFSFIFLCMLVNKGGFPCDNTGIISLKSHDTFNFFS